MGGRTSKQKPTDSGRDGQEPHEEPWRGGSDGLVEDRGFDGILELIVLVVRVTIGDERGL